jgi:transposase
MSQLTSNEKHNILKLYVKRSTTHGFVALARQHCISGGEKVIRNWFKQWDGTPQSLERKQGSGRPTKLTPAQVNDCIRTPIRNKNRAAVPVHYPQLLPAIQEKTGEPVSLRTVQRTGKEQLGVKQKRTKKRTREERKQL